MKNIHRITLALIATCLLTSTSESATVLLIERELEFVDSFTGTNMGSGTTVKDVYRTTNTTSLVIPADTYDSVEITISFGAGKRLEVQDVISPVNASFSIDWGANTVHSLRTVDLSYEDGFGALPASGIAPLPFSMNEPADALRFNVSYSQIEGAFGFSSVTFTYTFDERNVGDTFTFLDQDFNFRYVTDQIIEGGRFTSITAVPEPTSALFLCGSGALTCLCRRRRK